MGAKPRPEPAWRAPLVACLVVLAIVFGAWAARPARTVDPDLVRAVEETLAREAQLGQPRGFELPALPAVPELSRPES